MIQVFYIWSVLVFSNISTLVITKEKTETILSITDLYYYEDTTNNLTFKQILTDSSQFPFQLNPDFKPEDYNRNSAYWVKMKFKLPPQKGNYVLEFYDQTIDSKLTKKLLHMLHCHMHNIITYPTVQFWTKALLLK